MWTAWVYDGNAAERARAVRLLRETPELTAGDPWLACAGGDAATLQRVLDRDSDWVHRPGGPFAMPPLVAVTHSRLIAEPGFEAPLLACARLLLAHGADVDGTWIDPRWPGAPLSALYGAAGRTHHAGMTALLLAAGADPNDNESLYHSVEAPEPACTRLLLDAGARVVGTNAIGRVLDYDKLAALRMLLRQGGDARERPWIHHAVLRGRSLDHIRALAEAGADLEARNDEGLSLYRWASMHGRDDVVALLDAAGIEARLTLSERFVAACARGDEAEARALDADAPGILARLGVGQLATLPRLAGIGHLRGVRTMLALGWPTEVKAGWDATALNLAIFQGDAEMARLLLEHGADWRTPHGFGDNVIGTLSFASRSDDIEDPAPRDYVGCARVLLDHGVPLQRLDVDAVSAEVAAFIATARPGADDTKP